MNEKKLEKLETKDLQIVINLKDLYDEHDEHGSPIDFNEAIKEEIFSQAIDRIVKGFSNEVRNEMKGQMIDRFEGKYDKKIEKRIDMAIKRGLFNWDGNNVFNLAMYVKQVFERFTSQQRIEKAIEDKIEERIEGMIEKLQDRYDMKFASGIIKNLKDNNLLKPGAADLLIDKEK